MKKQIINYETLVKITGAISSIRDPEEVVLVTVESVKTALDVKGCTLFLINRKTNELKIAASYGLSQNYLDKGPISSLKSIAESLEEGPVAIYDVADDPRLQYPGEAKKEGIASILSVPIKVHDMAQIAGMAIDLCRLNKGYKSSIEILKTMRDPKLLKSA
jgi:signal transduction protein with GAF and PtsI domain